MWSSIRRPRGRCCMGRRSREAGRSRTHCTGRSWIPWIRRPMRAMPSGEWHHLGGADVLWQPQGRVEVSGEALFGEGSREDGALWGLYAQVVMETVRTLYLVGRYE